MASADGKAAAAAAPSEDEGGHVERLIRGIGEMMPDAGTLFSGDSDSDDDDDRSSTADSRGSSFQEAASVSSSVDPDDGSNSNSNSNSTSSSASASSPGRRADDDSSGMSEDVTVDEPTDRYGFFLSSLKATIELPPREIERRQRKEVTRQVKWQDMTSHWDRFLRGRTDVVKRRIRKGIPDTLRGSVWPTLGRVPEMVLARPRAYADLLRAANAAAARNYPEDQCHETIERDITRTFPRHRMFSKDGDGGGKSGLTSLRNVLRAYSAFDKDVQYCQGMGFFTAMFLIYMPEEQAFWQLVGVMGGQGVDPATVVSYRPDAIIDLDDLHVPTVAAPAPPPLPAGAGSGTRSSKRPVRKSARNSLSKLPVLTGLGGTEATGEQKGFRGLFMPDMAETHMALHTMEKLVARHLPRVAKHFAAENILFSMFATNWYLTVFSSSFPFDLVTRVWDCFLAEGYKVVHRVAVGLLKKFQAEILSSDFEGIMDLLQHTIPNLVDPEEIMKISFRLPIKKSYIDSVQREYYENMLEHRAER